jgi:hypothetical protein
MPSKQPSISKERKLLITGIMEGGSAPDAVELYALEDVNLDGYAIGSSQNEVLVQSPEFFFPAQEVPKGTFIYVVRCGDFTKFVSFFGNTLPPTARGYIANWEFLPVVPSESDSDCGDSLDTFQWSGGNDAVELFYEEMVVDVYGVPGDNGSRDPWEYEDGWAYRQCGLEPTAVWDEVQWLVFESAFDRGSCTSASINSDCQLADISDSGFRLTVPTRFPLGTFTPQDCLVNPPTPAP